MSTPRREFLSWLGASGLYAAAGAPIPSVDRKPSVPTPIAADFDMSWVDKIKTKHRAVFDSPAVNEGGALFRAVIWRKQHKQVYGTDPADMNPVVIFRHEGIPLVMDDSYWEQFKVGKEVKWKSDVTKKWNTVNPIRVAAPGTPPAAADYNLDAFFKSGGIVLACNLAFGQVVAQYAGDDKKLSRDDARKKALEHLIPGVILQPSGLFAAIAAQEAGCHYVMGS